MGRSGWQVLAFLGLIAAGCGDGARFNGVNPKDLAIAVQGGDQQVWSPSSPAPKPLQVVVTKAATHEPVPKVTVNWSVTQGTGASVSPASSVTDSSGIASTNVTLGPIGVYKVTAGVTGMVSPPAVFTLEAAGAATVTGMTPANAQTGDTITIIGSGFSTIPENNIVLFAGVRGAVVSATATQMRVLVPLCLPTATTPVVVVRGPYNTPAGSLAVTGTAGNALSLTVGQVAVLTDPTALNCARLPAGGSYLLVVENATDVSNRPMDYQLLGIGSGVSTSTRGLFPRAYAFANSGYDAAADFDARLRLSEDTLVRRAKRSGALQAPRLLPQSSQQALAVPNVGDSATFNVLNDLNSSTSFTTVKAKVTLVTPTSIIYQDVNAPANGFSPTDFQQFGSLFDDPIYPTDVSVFGQPSDIDQNGHIIILFTPVVNKLTPRTSTSFIAGFFYGCDLLPATACAKTNRAEIFYAAVPDPNGTVGIALSRTRIMQTTPPVLAHEFMHMIHFNQRVLLRQADEESLWLSEALAHTAEDTVGGVFLARGDSARAIQFMSENWDRANDYLENTAGTSLLAFESPGTLAERGAGWLFLKYLRGRFGGQVITKVTQACASIPCPDAPNSADNVVAQTSLGWSILINDWSVALWASDAPQLAGVIIDPRYTFPNFKLRRILGQPALGGVYLLQPTVESFTGFNTGTQTVLSATSAYYTVAGSAATGPLAVSLAAPGGSPFTSTIVPQLAILRYQ